MKNSIIWVMFCLSVLFSLLFYRQAIGVNLLIFEGLALPLMLWNYSPFKKTGIFWFMFVGTVLSLFSVFFYHTAWSFTVHLIFAFMFAAFMSFPTMRSLLHLWVESIAHIITSQIGFFVFLARKPKNRISWGKFGRVLKWGLIPLAIIILFIFLYRIANPIFNNQIIRLIDAINYWLSFITWGWFWMAVFGFFLCTIFFVKFSHSLMHNNDIAAKDTMTRLPRRRGRSFRFSSLINEYKSAIFLLVALNALILYLNVIDIIWVWFGFEWNGDYLKQFVHSGTWILVVSILISMFIVIYYFRRNLNFYSKNKWLKVLATLWMVQNFIMTISVVIRNLWYINYFALAYKRIAVLFFLLLVIIGIISVIVKIYHRKTGYWLVRVNSIALFSVLLISVFINWDLMIAKYNFSHYERSFVHFNFLEKMSTNALPELDKTPEELQVIHETQKHKMPFDVEDRVKYMDYVTYYSAIQSKKANFCKKYESRHWLSWNYADYRTYKALKSK
ncbi:MAG: DUF4173 domain-containing protein [Bacteroidales bacterium]|nr:DUF4173 domain-containing protein [Bacteroidales bacterium]HOY38440.1 DUF4173 domain-containing protein [Bacteroidales bacterium]HQP03131.1 DUF4173 domain-containing protein [Bacteroidales bacterium]